MIPRSPDRGLYLHIPFCHARCGYCDFVTFTGKEDKIDQYVEALCKEISLYGQSEQSKDSKQNSEGKDASAICPLSALPALIQTVFFGGGTPSLLEPHHVAQILSAVRSHFVLDPDAEITMEANPESIRFEKAQGWSQAGVNRLSIGLQVFDNALLKKIDRLHTVEEFLAAYHAVRRAGIDNVNIDLIYGFEGQTRSSWQDTLQSTVALNPEHLSLYALKIEEHTPFSAKGIRVDEDLEADMYDWARVYLKDHGYEQYEISNFSRSGKACRHNLIYWRQEDYYGLGVGAVGCVQGVRWENHKTRQAYHEDVRKGRLPRASTEVLDPRTRQFERLMLGLRLREGLDWQESRPEWLSHRFSLFERGLLEEVRPGRWRVPDSAVALTNQILLPFL